jgi:hypothetical protein
MEGRRGKRIRKGETKTRKGMMIKRIKRTGAEIER